MATLATALVTGASRGIGRAIASRLSRDGFGVVLADLPSQKSQLEEVHAHITQQGGKAMTVFADVSVENQVNQMVEKVVEQMGGLDVMVANAGICSTSTFLGTTTEDLYRMFTVNTVGTFLCYKYAAQQMIKQGRGGRIIGACSVVGKIGWPMLTAYSTSKFAVRGLTQNAALDLVKHGITVNAYAPGPTNTQMMHGIHDSAETQLSKPEVEDLDKKQISPIGFYGDPEDVANLVSYIASKESRMMTGQTASDFLKLLETVIDTIPRFLLTVEYSSTRKKSGWHYAGSYPSSLRWINEVRKEDVVDWRKWHSGPEE